MTLVYLVYTLAIVSLIAGIMETRKRVQYLVVCIDTAVFIGLMWKPMGLLFAPGAGMFDFVAVGWLGLNAALPLAALVIGLAIQHAVDACYAFFDDMVDPPLNLR